MWSMFSIYKNNQKSESVRVAEKSSARRDWVTDSAYPSYRYDYNETIDDDEDAIPLTALNTQISLKRPLNNDISGLKKLKLEVAAEKPHDMVPGIPFQKGSLGTDLRYHYENEPIEKDDLSAVSRLETNAWNFNRYFQSDVVYERNKFHK